MHFNRPDAEQNHCSIPLVLRRALVGSIPWAMLVSAGLLWIYSANYFRVRPSPTPLTGLLEAVQVGHAVLLALFLAASACSLALYLAVTLFFRARRSSAPCFMALAAPTVITLTFTLLLVANVRYLRFRYAPISLLTDAIIVALGLGLLVVCSRLAARWPPVVHFLDSSGLLWMGVFALLVGLPAHLMNLDPGGRHTTLGASRNQDKIPIGSPTSTEAIPSPATRWNVVLISIDTLRPDRLGAYGYDRAISPNTDRFAEGGVLFSRAYSTAPWTLPAHMSMITGLLPSMHGAQLSPVFTKKTEILSDDKTTLAEVLSYNNYRTAAFTGGSFLGRDFGFQQGFDELKTGGCLADLWEEARRWLESGSDQPFFLFLHTYEVHNYEPSPEFEEKWVRPIDSESARRLDDRNRLRQFILTSGFFNLNDEELTFISDLYDATIAEADHVLGDIWQYLDEENLSERTVVVLTSDHGEEFFEHGGTGHGFTFYEEMLRIPWILRVPGGPTGVKVDQPVQLIDMMPTILDLLGLAGPAGMQGVSLREVFQGERSGLLTERALIAEASHLGNARSLIHQDTKVIRSKYLPVELSSLDRLLFNLRQLLTRSDDLFFDVAQDPRELRPLEPADLDQGQELLDLLQAHESIADEGGASNPAVEGLSPESIEDLKALGYLQ